MMKRLHTGILLVGVCALAAVALPRAAPAAAQSPAEFYKDRVLTIILGAGPGGGYDLYSRTVMKHLVGHIPGRPKYVLQFMPGAGGLKAANYVYTVVAKDGSKLAKLSNMLPVFQLLGTGVKYDTSKLNYIGRAASMQYVTMVWHTTGVKSLADARKIKKPVIFGSTGKMQSNYIVPTVMQKLLGANFKVIAGYPGTSAMMKALEQGEIHGRAGSWSSWISRSGRFIDSGQVVAIAQSGLEKATDIKDGYGNPAPLLLDLAKNDDERAILKLLASDAAVGRNFSVPPGVPRDRVEALCRAFDATMADPAFLSDAKARKLIIEPKTCEWLNKTVAEVIATPKPLIAKTKKMLGWK